MAPRNQPYPGEHPTPPESFYKRPLPLIEAPGPWFRMHHVDREPLCFGVSGNNRFDDPQHQSGVLDAGNGAHCAFIETFGQVDITRDALVKRRLCRIAASRFLRLVDLSAAGLARIGADGRLTAGSHAIAQRWSRTCWEHQAAPDGLAYRARHDQSRVCVAIVNQPDITFTLANLGTLLETELHDLFNHILETYGFGLA